MDLVLVDDHLAYRQSLCIALSKLTAHRVIGEAIGARDGRFLIEKQKPDLAIVDFLLGDGNGISLANDLRRRGNRTPILLLGRLSRPMVLRDALRAGIRGYVTKGEPLAEVIRAIERIGAGALHLSPQVEPLLQQLEDDPRLESLSLREREVLYLLVDGASTKEIAQALCISVRTVDAHRLHINRKFAVRSARQLVRCAARLGLVA